MRVLENNNKPATHFIEVWRNPESELIDEWNFPYASEIEQLDRDVSTTENFKFITIAIFKIRAK